VVHPLFTVWDGYKVIRDLLATTSGHP
jgi:hypothetical protein